MQVKKDSGDKPVDGVDVEIKTSGGPADDMTAASSAAVIEGGDDEEEEPISMKFPVGEGWKKILVYLVSFPIMFPLWLTLPDTKNPASELAFSCCLLTVFH